jgi:hypothetical protein
MLAQQTIPASRDARKAPPMTPDVDIPFVPWAHLAVLNALDRRRRALEATLAGRPVTIVTTSPTGSDDVTDRYVVDLKIELRLAAGARRCRARRCRMSARQYGDSCRRRAFLGVEYG